MTILEQKNAQEPHRSSCARPVNFEQHWRAAVPAVSTVSSEMANIQNPFAIYEVLTVNDSVHARCIRPVGGNRLPTVLMYHDLGIGIRGWHHMTRYAGLGYAVIAMENPLPANTTMETLSEASWNRCYQNAALLLSAAKTLPYVDPRHLVTWGEGFGGGLAIVAAALAETEVLCMSLNPMPAECGASRAYLDLVHFAPMIRGSLLMGTCMLDTVAPPVSQTAVFQAANCEKRQIIYPAYAHERVNFFENEMLKAMCF